eukprot:RCo040964
MSLIEIHYRHDPYSVDGPVKFAVFKTLPPQEPSGRNVEDNRGRYALAPVSLHHTPQTSGRATPTADSAPDQYELSSSASTTDEIHSNHSDAGTLVGPSPHRFPPHGRPPAGLPPHPAIVAGPPMGPSAR